MTYIQIALHPMNVRENNNPTYGMSKVVSTLTAHVSLKGSADSSRSIEEKSLSEEVSQLVEDIEEFRTFLADQYAEELVNNLEGNCVTH